MADAEVSAQIDADLQTTETSSPPSSPASSSSFFSTASPPLLPASSPLPLPSLSSSLSASLAAAAAASTSPASETKSSRKKSSIREKSSSPSLQRERSPSLQQEPLSPQENRSPSPHQSPQQEKSASSRKPISASGRSSPQREKSPSPHREKSPSPQREKSPSPLPAAVRSSLKKAPDGKKKVSDEKKKAVDDNHEGDDPTIDEGISDEICGVCWEEDAEETEENDIVFCDGCNIAVHQKCYGVGKIPEGEWFCDKCVYMKKNPTLVRPRCCLCSILEGPLKKFHEKNKWAHSSCVLFGWEGFHYHDEIKKLGVKSNNKIWAEREKWLKCKICGEAKFNIQCAEKKCHIAFHPTCAKKKGYKSVYQSVDLDWIEDQENNWDVVRYFLCEKHRDMSVKTYVDNHKNTLGKAGNKDDDEEDDSSITSSFNTERKRPSSKKSKQGQTPGPKCSSASSSSFSKSSSSSMRSSPAVSFSTVSSPAKKKLNSDEIFEELEETEAIESEKTEQEKTRKKDKGSKKEKKKEKRVREKETEREKEKEKKHKEKEANKKDKAKSSAIKTPSSPASSPRNVPLPSLLPSSSASESVIVGKLPTRAAVPVPVPGAINKVKPVDASQIGPRMKKELEKKRTQMLPVSIGDEALLREKKRKREEEEKAKRDEKDRNLRIKQEKEALAQLTQSLMRAPVKPMEKFVPKENPKPLSSSTSKYSGSRSRSRSPKGSHDGYKRDRDRGSDRDRGRDERRSHNYSSSRLGGGHKDRDMRPADRMPSWSRSQQVVHVPVYVPVPTFRPPPPPPRGPPPPPPRGPAASFSNGSRDQDYRPNFEVSWGGVDPRRPAVALSSSRGSANDSSSWNAPNPSSTSWESQYGSSAVENVIQAMEGGDVALDLLHMLSSLDSQPKVQA